MKRSASHVGVVKAMSVNKSSQSIEITGLEPFTYYDVWVSAFTAVGSGPPSRPVTVMTDEDGKYITWHCRESNILCYGLLMVLIAVFKFG